jgi:hypothetical protein
VDQGDCLPSVDRFFDFGEPGDHLTGLGGYGEGFNQPSDHELVDIVGESLRHLNGALETLGENVASRGFRDGGMGQ